MMRFHLPRSLVIFALLLCGAARLTAQDVHFTLHPMAPLAFNPANTGNFYGTYRLSGLYRDQYRTVSGKGAYMTPTFSIDLPVLRGFRKKDWVGVGMFFFSDRSGDAGLTVSTLKISAAYHFALNKTGNTYLSVAYQTGSLQRQIKNFQDLQFEDGLVSGGSSIDLGFIDQMKKGFLDHIGGLKLTSKFNKTDEWYVGAAMGKFGRPNWSLLTQGSSYQVEPRMYLHGGFSTVMTDRVRLSPNITYQKIMDAPENTLVVQGVVDYLFDPAKNLVLIGGLGYRTGAGIGDALQIMAGAVVKDVRVMLGYDVNISSLAEASGSVGALELSAQYIGRIYKRPKPDPVIFCPRF
jgi:type IX secretion system PorP/SprF family membrane protein